MAAGLAAGIAAASTALDLSTVGTGSDEAKRCVAYLRHEAFDKEASVALITMVKMLDALVRRPHDQRVRTIRLTNPNFFARVGTFTGAVGCLLAAGFQRCAIAGQPHLVLRNDVGPVDVLLVREVCAAEAAALGATVRPAPVPVTEAPAAAPPVEFDPFKPMITRVAPKPTAGGIARAGTQALGTDGAPQDSRTVVQMRVDRLRARQQRLQQGKVPPRKTMLVRYGDLVMPANTAESGRASSGAGAGRSDGRSPPSDAEILRRAMQRKAQELEQSTVRCSARCR